jgi:hypothetical protein
VKLSGIVSCVPFELLASILVILLDFTIEQVLLQAGAGKMMLV